MNVLDVNVLLALYRGDHIHHESARQWWADSQSRGEPFTVPDIVWVGFVRIATNRRILPVPASLDQAWDFIQKVQMQPTYLAFSADSRTLGRFADLADDAGATADLVTDAYIAATASTFGGTVVTFDRDFRRFDGVRVTELTG